MCRLCFCLRRARAWFHAPLCLPFCLSFAHARTLAVSFCPLSLWAASARTPQPSSVDAHAEQASTHTPGDAAPGHGHKSLAQPALAFMPPFATFTYRACLFFPTLSPPALWSISFFFRQRTDTLVRISRHE
nr:hypothetical protein [Pandoravirus massiliensis]